MTEYTFKNIANLEVAEELTDKTKIVIENNGSLKRIDKEQIDKNINVTGTLRIEDGATLEVAEGATVNGLATGGGGLYRLYSNGLNIFHDADFDKGVTKEELLELAEKYILYVKEEDPYYDNYNVHYVVRIEACNGYSDVWFSYEGFGSRSTIEHTEYIPL